jgi:hypothetical protein
MQEEGATAVQEVEYVRAEGVIGERKRIEEMKKELFNLDGFAVNGVAWFRWPVNTVK